MKANEIWHDATPDATVELTSVMAENLVTEDIIFTVATESISGGTLRFYAMVFPLGNSDCQVAA